MKTMTTGFNLTVGLSALVLLTLCFMKLAVRAHEPQPVSPILPANTTGIYPTVLADHRDGPIFGPPGITSAGGVVGRGQMLSLKLTNLIELKGQDPVAIFVRVRLSDADGREITQSAEVKIPPKGTHPFTFKRAALRSSGEPGTGRLPVRVNGWIRYEYRSHDRDSEDAYPFIRDARASGMLPVLVQLIDESNGRTTTLHQDGKKKTDTRLPVPRPAEKSAERDRQPNPVPDRIRIVDAPSNGDPDRPITLGSVPNAQTKTVASLPATQLQFVGQEPYEVNGSKGTRFKLSVTNRASLPDFLWQQSANLPPCGEHENASRTWVEIFGSPGDKRLHGFCGLRSSDDLGQLWFAVPAGVKGPQCVYLVMTDRQTGKKYKSERICSRLFSLVTGRLKGGDTAQARQDPLVDVISWHYGVTDQKPQKFHPLPTPIRILDTRSSASAAARQTELKVTAERAKENDPGQRANKVARMSQPDLSIRQFLFPPTNDKALRVQIENQGNAASGACRLILTVRKINGVAVGRTTYVTVPALAAGADVWLQIDVKSILPNDVSLQSTTFKLNVDATYIVAESDERNNEVWHGLTATAAIGKAVGNFANDGDEDAPGKPETSDTQQLSAGPNQQKKPPRGCLPVGKRWFVCASFKNKTVGGGFQFNQIDPNGRVLASRTYKDCTELAADKTIPADLRAKAAGPCRQSLKLAVKEAAVQ